MVLRFGSPLGLCAHVLTSFASFEWMLQLVSCTLPPTIERPPPCRRNGARIGSVARKVLPSGRWDKVAGNGKCSGLLSARVLGHALT